MFLFPYNGNTLVHPHPHHQWACLSLQLHNWPGVTRRWKYNVRIPGGYLERKTQVILTFWVKTKRQDPDTKKSKVTIKRQKLSLVSDLCCLLWKVFARGWEPKRADANLVLIKMDKKGAFGKRAYFQIFVKQFWTPKLDSIATTLFRRQNTKNYTDVETRGLV